MQLWQVFWEIALWRRGPRDVPASGAVFAFTAVVYTATSVFQSFLLAGEEDAFTLGLADLAITLGLFSFVLLVSRHAHRWLQTSTAVLGCGTLFMLPSIGLLLVGQLLPSGGPLAFLVSLASLPLLVWYLFVLGHIVRHAIDSPLITGMAVAMTYFVVSYAAVMHIAPPAPASVPVKATSGS